MEQLPDMNTLMKLARSPAGQTLLALLQNSDPTALKAITADAASGNIRDAGRKLSNMLDPKEISELMKQLEQQL